LEAILPFTVIIHVLNEEPVVGEIEELPAAGDTMVAVRNPRKMDGKDLHYLADKVVTVYWPVSRLNFLEIISGREEEEIIGFVRE
jgi:hypothetical protein